MKNNSSNQVLTNNSVRKKQTDRLLKQLPLADRRRQLAIRELIASDEQFAAI